MMPVVPTWTCPQCGVVIENSVDPAGFHKCSPRRRSCPATRVIEETAGMQLRRQQLQSAVASGGLPEVTTRHLLYHVYPSKRNDGWRDNVRQLVKNIDLFNGKRLIAVAVGSGTHLIDEVVKEFDCNARFFEFANDPLLREVSTFAPLLTHCIGMKESDLVFYAHTKGNSTAENVDGALLWRNIGYARLLDQYEQLVAPACNQYAAVGIHKIYWSNYAVPPYPTRLMHGNWMFAGTFFWFRPMFTHGCDDWRNVPVDRYGAEAWLSGLLSHDTVKSVYQIWDPLVYPTPNPYDPNAYPEEDRIKYGGKIFSRPPGY